MNRSSLSLVFFLLGCKIILFEDIMIRKATIQDIDQVEQIYLKILQHEQELSIYCA